MIKNSQISKQSGWPLTSIDNFRELGGYMTIDERVIKKGCLWRAGHLSRLSSADYYRLYEKGIRTVIDLRSTSEVANYPDRLGARINYLRIPILDDDLTVNNTENRRIQKKLARDPRAGFRRMLLAYRQLIEKQEAQAGYYHFIKTLCSTAARGGILFHCSAGKDRTGLAAIYLLNILHVSPKTIFQDYVLTNRASSSRIRKRIRAASKSGLGISFIQSVHDLSIASPYYYQQAIATIDSQYGGMQSYLHDVLQVNSSMTEQLEYLFVNNRARMLVNQNYKIIR